MNTILHEDEETKQYSQNSRDNKITKRLTRQKLFKTHPNRKNWGSDLMLP